MAKYIMQPTASGYLRYLLAPFFRNWWAVLTGCASLLAMYVTPAPGVILSGPFVMTTTFVVLTLVFLTLSAITQGWALYAGQLRGLRVASFERNRDVSSGWVFVLAGDVDLPVGTVVDVHKRVGVVEVPLALAQVVTRNSSGAYQAVPIGRLNPVHIREHTAGGLKPSDLVVRVSIDIQRMKEAINDLG